MIWMVLFIGLSAGLIMGVFLMGILQMLSIEESNPEPMPPHPEREPVFYDQDKVA